MLPIKPLEVKATGNDEVVALFKRWLERAEEGRLAFAAVVACENPVHAVSEYGGHLEMMYAANWQLDTLKHQLQIRLVTQHSLPANVDPTADRACYNISKGPACYDFLAWLIIAEMNRRRAGAPAPLKVGFVMLDSEEERVKHEKYRRAFYDGVIMPSLAFVGAVLEDEACGVKPLERYTFAPIVDFAKAGEEVPLLVPSPEGMAAIAEYLQAETEGNAPVTITLRESTNMEERNSNLTEWLKVAEYIEAQGERVIFVRDTAKALEPITGFRTCPAASIDLDTRQALYESAKCNLFVSNGPWSLALFGTRPWLMFCEVRSMNSYFPNTPQFWRTWHNLDPATQDSYPWSRPNQRIIWQRDDADKIIAAWEQLRPLLAEPVREAAE